jgi:predicted ATPase
VLAGVVTRPPHELATALEALQGAEFIFETTSWSGPAFSFKHALTQEVAYRTLPEPARRRLHARVAEAIEACAPEIGERRPEILARHHAEGDRPEPAIGYWRRAGQLAIRRSAHVEAVAHLTRGLELVRSLGGGARWAREELSLLLELGTALAATRGYAAPEVADSLERARALVDTLGESAELFPVRWALWRFAFARADFRGAGALAAALRETAERQADDGLRLAAGVAAGIVRFYAGELAAARADLEAACRLHDPGRAPAQIPVLGQDPGAVGLGFLGWARAVAGELGRAAAAADEGLALARAARHPFTLASALYLAALVAQLRGDGPRLRDLGAELQALSREHSFRLFEAFGLMVSGWAARAAGDVGEAVRLMREGAERFRSMGQRAGLSHRALLAEALFAAGARDAGLEVLAGALRQAAETGEGAFAAELHRLRGEELARQGRAADAEADLRQALALASRQGAWLFALRAASALAGLTAPGGAARGDALRSLAEVAARLAAEPDAAEVRAARSLLAGGRSPA